ncbi:hypothetical protein A7D00_3274 [Trichophyton violaceum]|uniref:Uncharacterized protein n=1 Tax=Trichophyton violaceum TaxID=34388 RepID=A0A178FK00_TRIVO|nr:hypothetical protein A7D00_3274 [Trichophyton violaceum]
MATGPKVKKPEPPKPCASEYLDRLDLAEAATVVFPLSEKIRVIFARYSDGSLDEKTEGRRVPTREDIVAKAIMGNKEYTEYTILQYLERRMPDIPVPRPHGLIIFAPFSVIFMSYIPDMTLTKAWPSLAHEDKLFIQRQLDDIFHRLRTIRQDDGHPFSGISGEGAKDMRVDECSTFKDITTGFNH